MSPAKEVENAYRASIKIEKSAKKEGWGVHKEEFELAPLSAFGPSGHLTIFFFTKDLMIKEVAGAVHREGKRDFVFGPNELLKGLR